MPRKIPHSCLSYRLIVCSLHQHQQMHLVVWRMTLHLELNHALMFYAFFMLLPGTYTTSLLVYSLVVSHLHKKAFMMCSRNSMVVHQSHQFYDRYILHKRMYFFAEEKWKYSYVVVLASFTFIIISLLFDILCSKKMRCSKHFLELSLHYHQSRRVELEAQIYGDIRTLNLSNWNLLRLI